MTLARIGFAFNPTNPAAVELRERAEAWCRLRKVEAWASPSGEYETVIRELPTTDVLVVLGGDGTFLRAARAVAEVDVPILGVNLGKVGFLSKVEAHELETVLAQVANGEYRIDERMTIEATILRAG
ncbi:MAG TPA: NAD(+)/NADH kinase, partial [Candidatus Acidoferrum sp.]|nr:NAD(+)/NADH kinase [Candidatus Acidoferrum sp.]